MKNPFKDNLLPLVFLSTASLAVADIYTWNGSTTGALGGVDNEWNTTTQNWTGVATSWPSTSTTDDDASFGNTAGSVVLTTTVSANDIIFATGGYTVGADNTAGIIILDGTNPTITGATGSLSSIGAKIQGSSGLTKAGSATIQLRGVNTYTGDTRVLRGNLLIGAGNNRLPTTTKLVLGDPLTNTNGVFQMNSRSQQVGGLETAGTSTGNRVINSSATATTFTVSNASDFVFGGILGGTGTNDNNYNFTKSGSGKLTLTSTNTYTGTTTVSGGTLELGHATNTLFDTGLVNVNGGTLDIADKNETIGALTVTSGAIAATTGSLIAPSCAGKGGSINAVLAGTTNLSGTDTFWLTKDTAGTLTLSAANTFTGNIVVTAGRLTLANSSALGVADPTTGGTNRKGLVMQGGSRSLWLKGGITIPSNIDFFLSSNSTDGGGINNESEDNEIQGPLYFSTGNAALNISSAAGKLTISGNITMTQTTRTLYLGGASENNNSISGTISESTANVMPVIKQNTGKWIFSGTNTYKGDTTINGGTLVFANGGSQKFYPKSDASSNKITGNGATTTLDGAFVIDLTDAILAPDLTSWLLVDVDNITETFDTNFTVSGFAETAPNSGIWKKIESGKTFTFTEGDGRLVVSPAATNTFADWLVTNSPATGFQTDSDNDGVSNGLENVFGTNPNAYSAGLANVSASGSAASYTHTLNPHIASDVSFAYEWSTDLVEWMPSGATNTGGTTSTITASAPVLNVVTVTTTISSGPANGIFTRIKATLP